jgi:hypothetical protein
MKIQTKALLVALVVTGSALCVTAGMALWVSCW